MLLQLRNVRTDMQNDQCFIQNFLSKTECLWTNMIVYSVYQNDVYIRWGEFAGGIMIRHVLIWNKEHLQWYLKRYNINGCTCIDLFKKVYLLYDTNRNPRNKKIFWCVLRVYIWWTTYFSYLQSYKYVLYQHNLPFDTKKVI